MGGDAAEADTSALRMPDAARRSLGRATNALRRYGWLGFWSQLAVSIISGVILLFSVAFTSQVRRGLLCPAAGRRLRCARSGATTPCPTRHHAPVRCTGQASLARGRGVIDRAARPPHAVLQGGPKVSLYLTLVGILAGFLSTFWNFGYLRTANRMQDYLNGADVAKVKKQAVRAAAPRLAAHTPRQRPTAQPPTSCRRRARAPRHVTLLPLWRPCCAGDRHADSWRDDQRGRPGRHPPGHPNHGWHAGGQDAVQCQVGAAQPALVAGVWPA